MGGVRGEGEGHSKFRSGSAIARLLNYGPKRVTSWLDMLTPWSYLVTTWPILDLATPESDTMTLKHNK